jgi:hypothetical protein
VSKGADRLFDIKIEELKKGLERKEELRKEELPKGISDLLPMLERGKEARDIIQY